MKRFSWFAAVCLLAPLALVGCNSDDDNPQMTIDSQFMEETLQETALPVLQALAMAFEADDAAVVKVADEVCDSNDCPGGGSQELCLTGLGNTFEMTLTYADCSANGNLVDGTFEMSAADGQITLIYNLHLNEAYLTGTITGMESDGCNNVTLSSFGVTVGGRSASTSGNLAYCGADWPDGTMLQSVTIAGVGSWLFDIVVFSNGTANIDVTDGQGADVAACSANLATQTFTCQMLNQGGTI